MKSLDAVCVAARRASSELATSTVQTRNDVLVFFMEELISRQNLIETANRQDCLEVDNSSPLAKRLDCCGPKFTAMVDAVKSVIKLPDPLGVEMSSRELTAGLDLRQISCPIGLVAVIFEARPEVGVQIASLAIKSGNALILKGGKEAQKSNRAIFDALVAALDHSQTMSRDIVHLVETREEISHLLLLDKFIDLIIPRGSNELVRSIKANTKIPVLGHADGICSVYIDKSAEFPLAVKIVRDSKCNYPAACNAMETLIVHREIAPQMLKLISDDLQPYGCQFIADDFARKFLPAECTRQADEDDFEREFLSLEFAIKVVDSVDQAIDHINSHGSRHTDVIISSCPETTKKFQNSINSACVFHNCSSRFADGFRFGLGAEVGISTNKIHARGPVGLEGLTIYKYLLNGCGHIVEGMKAEDYTHLDKSRK